MVYGTKKGLEDGLEKCLLSYMKMFHMSYVIFILFSGNYGVLLVSIFIRRLVNDCRHFYPIVAVL